MWWATLSSQSDFPLTMTNIIRKKKLAQPGPLPSIYGVRQHSRLLYDQSTLALIFRCQSQTSVHSFLSYFSKRLFSLNLLGRGNNVSVWGQSEHVQHCDNSQDSHLKSLLLREKRSYQSSPALKLLTAPYNWVVRLWRGRIYTAKCHERGKWEMM